MFKILLTGLVTGEPTPFDGQWLAAYDPTRPGVDPHGKPMIAHVVTTDDSFQALEFGSLAEAEECWKRSFGVRRDGRPNRPLTAFMIEVLPSGIAATRHGKMPSKAALVAFVSELFYG